MVNTRSRSYCNFIMFKDTSLLPHERFISLPSLLGKIFDLIVESGKGLAVDFELYEMVETLLGEFPLRGWRTYLLTCLIMEISEKDSKATEILDEDVDTRYKESHVIIDIDTISDNLFSYKYKRKRAVFLNHCIEKIMKSKQIRFENIKKDVLLDIERLHLIINRSTVSFLDQVAKEIVWTDAAI